LNEECSSDSIDDLLLFAFESNRVLGTLALSRGEMTSSDDECFFSGFQSDDCFDLELNDNDNIDYYLFSGTVQKMYAYGLRLTTHQTFTYENTIYGWARSALESLKTERLAILRGLPLGHALPGGAVINSGGKLAGLFKKSFENNIGLVT
jgi:hypothetical protein